MYFTLLAVTIAAPPVGQAITAHRARPAVTQCGALVEECEMPDADIAFQVWESAEGGYEAQAVGHTTFTQADYREDLKHMMQDAALCHFDDEAPGVSDFMPR